MSDTFLPGSGFDTYEQQDKVLVGLCGGTGCKAAVRILQQQGFAVMGAVVRLCTDDPVVEAIPSPLPLGQSLLVVWPQLTGLIAATVICFAISYIMFMRREIRSR